MKSAERGPVKLVVRVEKGTLSIAEKVNLRIEAIAESGVVVEMPSFGSKLSEFDILDFREWADVPAGGRAGAGQKPTAGARQWMQEYVLQGFLSGEQDLPAITAKFHDQRDPGKTIDGEVSTEPFKIKVTSLLSGEFDPQKFRDIKNAVDLPLERERVWLWWTAGGAGVALAVILVSWWLLRRARKAAVPAPLSPHEWAFFALQRLQEDRLIEAGRVQEFYFRLSGIVREYIERRFGLMAPERTTPEFLAEVRTNAVLSREHQRLLTDFLQAADMVKFARYEPAPSEVEDSLTTARAFVDQTTSVPSDVAAKDKDAADVEGKSPGDESGNRELVETAEVAG